MVMLLLTPIMICLYVASSLRGSVPSSTIKRSVHFHGRTSIRPPKFSPSGTHSVGERPPDPKSLSDKLPDNVTKLKTWFKGKDNILCLTGAGISTESGIPDYRGHKGSYHKGHKPMIHDQFMKSHKMRQRYWGRSMIGWREFAATSPNEGHYALAELEKLGLIGVTFDDSIEYYKNGCDDAELKWAFSAGYQKMSIITQNVDDLHRKAGSDSQHITELHGRTDRMVCMTCGSRRCRNDFHDELDSVNSKWLQEQLAEIEAVAVDTDDNATETAETKQEQLRPDGDAFVRREEFDDIIIPACIDCKETNTNYNDNDNANDNDNEQMSSLGFYKPDVVFFGDSVPKHRVDRCYSAVDAADGLFCIGSSLAVHSAYRFVQRAALNGIPIAILNVGETRAEVSGLDVLKIEAPAGPTLTQLVKSFEAERS